jgi:hypothetical protein
VEKVTEEWFESLIHNQGDYSRISTKLQVEVDSFHCQAHAKGLDVSERTLICYMSRGRGRGPDVKPFGAVHA